jgi:parvulin-like peptidyl-prolyl isomerase
MKHPARVALALAALLSGGVAARSVAQGQADSGTVDRIMAVVGTRAILSSQVQEEVYGQVSSGKERLPNPSTDSVAFAKAMGVMMRRYVDTLVAFELLHEEAVTDTTVKVTDQEVNDAADAVISDARKKFKTQAEFRAQIHEIGFATEEDWRKWLVDNQRRVITVRRYEQSLRDDNKIKDKTPTAKEVRAFYDQHSDELGRQPATVSFKQILVAPKPNPISKARTLALADSLIDQLRNHGADFAILASRFSMDDSSRVHGGDLGWFQHGKMIREFEDVAFSLKPGTISDPVESPYGYHIIQVQRVQPGEVQARHILLIPEIDSAGARAAHALADSISVALRHGASFDSLQHLYHDRGEELELNNFPIDSLAVTPYGPSVATVDSGKSSTAFALPVAGHPLNAKWAVVQVTRRTPVGPPAFDDVKAGIRRMLATQLGEQDYIDQLRARTYVDIRAQ